jgi:hypothetical protein
MDVQFLRTASGTIAIAAVLIVIVLVFALRSVLFRVLSVVLVGAAVFGLVHYRQTLERCAKQGCECKLFGQRVPGDNCSAGSK